jgi:hypothetical protein
LEIEEIKKELQRTQRSHLNDDDDDDDEEDEEEQRDCIP